MYVPWMQATYFMAANKKALQYLPAGAKLDTLTYDQLAAWAANVREGDRPARAGLSRRADRADAPLHRGLSASVLHRRPWCTTFVSPAAETMWADFKALWAHVNPNSTNYNFMQEPLLSGDVLDRLGPRRAAAGRVPPAAR